MNYKTLFYLALILWLATLGWCIYEYISDETGPCENFSELPGDPETTKAQIRAYKHLLDSVDVTAKDSSAVIVVGGKSIPVTELAMELSLLRGYQLPHCELYQIIEEYGDDLDIFTMFAINPDAANREDSPIKYLDLYFQIITPDSTEVFVKGIQSKPGPAEDGFFDFPKPCPPTCPDEE